jgi:uncharacterized protein DUF4157
MAYDRKTRSPDGQRDHREAKGTTIAAPGRRTLTGAMDATPHGPERAVGAAPGRFTLTGGPIGMPYGAEAVPEHSPAVGGPAVQARALEGIAGSGQPLPYRAQIQALFGRHDVSGVTAHAGGEAKQAADDIGADAYATGDHIAFSRSPDLHTAAHEAAHVVQQRGGVQLKDSVGRPGDVYERHAGAVADRVAAGQSAEDLLDQMAGGSPTAAVQTQAAIARESTTTATGAPSGSAEPAGFAQPAPGINRPGFIDHPDGSNIRTGPAESGGQPLTPAPMPPTTRVFVSGHHPTPRSGGTSPHSFRVASCAATCRASA